MPKILLKSSRRRTWFLAAQIGLAVLLVLITGPSIALAQDGATPDAPAVPRLYLPALSSTGNQDALAENPSVHAADADGNVDGEWSYPRSDLNQTPVTCQDINNSSSDPTNENIVRYGQPIAAADCGNVVFRSGFGFNGSDSVTFQPGEPFLLGQFTHYNENIGPALIPMQFVDLTIRVDAPSDGIDVGMSYTMQLDETPNAGYCPYGSSNQTLCDDKVDFINNTPSQTIVIDGVTYTLEILGFVPGEAESCAYDANLADYFITGELMRNDACVFARFIQPGPAIAVEKSPDLQQITIGDYAEFEIRVSNPGNVGLRNVAVVDPLSPDCDRTIGDLKSGADVTYTCTAYDIETDFDNEATASGEFDGQVYLAIDTARVDVLAPDTATVHAIKYHDQNGNGTREAGEPGLFGWTLCVEDANGDTVGFCQVTDLDGNVTLAPNMPGDFQLCEVAQNGWINTDPGDGTACKPISVTQAALYAEFYPTVNDIYGVELVEKSENELAWNYTVYQFLESQALDGWVLALPSCIDASQIDPALTTAGWSLVDDTGVGATGLYGIRWEIPEGIPPEGAPFALAFVQPYPTGAANAGITVGGANPVSGVEPIAGPTCAAPVLIGNQTEAPAVGLLEVRKEVLPVNDSGFFNLAIDSVILATDVKNGGTTGKHEVPAGIHTVGEGAGTQTELDNYDRSLRCTETTRGTTWIPETTGEVHVGEGEDVVCTFTNVRRSAIQIIKQVVGTASADWAFSGGLGSFTLPATGGQREFPLLPPGTYPVAETQLAGWGLGALTCLDPDFGTQVDLSSASATIDLDPGETVICTFANVANAGSITVIKQVNGTAESPWFFDTALGEFSVDAVGGSKTFANITAGSYTVIERGKQDWHVAAIECTDPDGGTTVDPIAGIAIVDLDAGENITCTYVNEPGRPGILLEKSASASTIYPNSVVTYTFLASNTGQVPLKQVHIDDDRCVVAATTSGEFNAGDSNQNDWLDVGETWAFACTSTLAQDTTNTATAWAEASWGESVWSTDSAVVDVIAPLITLEKSADRVLVNPGETVTYRIVVRNAGDSALHDVAVDEGLEACELVGPTGDDGNNALDPGEAWSYTCSMIITADTVNVATVTGYDTLGNPWNADDRAKVEVYTPAIQLIKVADRAFVYPDEEIGFTVKVRNTGNTPLSDVNVADSLPQCVLTGPTGDDGDGKLAAGEEWTYACKLTVCPGQPLNTGSSSVGGSAVEGDSVTGWDIVGADAVVAPACTTPQPTLVGPSFGSCWSPTRRLFELTVVNKAPMPAYIGYDIYRVWNSFRNLGRFDVGQRSVFTVTQEGTLRKYISADGRTNWLQLGGTHTLNIAGHLAHGYICPETVTIPPICGDVTNRAEVTAKDGAGTVVRDSDTAFVDLIHPGIDVTKVVDKNEIQPGEQVNFTINVKNTGDIALTNVTVEDSLPACNLVGPAGDNANGILDPLENWVYTCDVAPVDDVTNTARVTGYDPRGTAWSDEDSATVDVVRPALEIVKEADKTVIYPGERVHFTLRVRNWGDVPLSRVNVIDSMPQCYLSRAEGDNGNRKLDPGEEWVYTCDVTFCKGEVVSPSGASEVGAACTVPGLCADATNTATVKAKDPRGRTLSAEASVFIDLIRPGLDVSKTANRTVVQPGDEVNYTIKVKNTGDTPLANVTLADSMPECQLRGPEGDNGNNILDAGERWKYSCSVALTRTTRNEATVKATDVRGGTWTDSDKVRVRVSSACVTVSGVQAIESCMAIEDALDADFFLFLPSMKR